MARPAVVLPGNRALDAVGKKLVGVQDLRRVAFGFRAALEYLAIGVAGYHKVFSLRLLDAGVDQRRPLALAIVFSFHAVVLIGQALRVISSFGFIDKCFSPFLVRRHDIKIAAPFFDPTAAAQGRAAFIKINCPLFPGKLLDR